MSTDDKPLFIPLRREWFEAFERGTKPNNEEWRAYGPRWNEETCRVGRAAILSMGYSGRRLERRIASFRKVPRAQAPEAARLIFPDTEYFAAIGLKPMQP